MSPVQPECFIWYQFIRRDADSVISVLSHGLDNINIGHGI